MGGGYRFRVIIAPVHRQARLFIEDSIREYGWDPHDRPLIVTRAEQLHGLDLRFHEVWWLDRLWPCSTREDVERMEAMKNYAKARGAKLRRWWT